VYLAAGKGNEAAAEFQKILDHSGIVWNCWTGALGRIGLARAYALAGETAKARAAYQYFFTLWKDRTASGSQDRVCQAANSLTRSPVDITLASAIRPRHNFRLVHYSLTSAADLLPRLLWRGQLINAGRRLICRRDAHQFSG
jgi:hypothetical protein